MLTREEAWKEDISQEAGFDPFYIQEQKMDEMMIYYIVGNESRYVYALFNSRKKAVDEMELMVMRAFLDATAIDPVTVWNRN